MTVEPEDQDTIALAGPVTIYEVVGVRERLATALAEGRRPRVDLHDAGPWDLAGLQLLIALIRSGHEHDVTIRLARVPAVCEEAALRFGLSDWLAGVRE